MGLACVGNLRRGSIDGMEIGRFKIKHYLLHLKIVFEIR